VTTDQHSNGPRKLQSQSSAGARSRGVAGGAFGGLGAVWSGGGTGSGFRLRDNPLFLELRNSGGDGKLPSWAVIAIAVGGVITLATCLVLCFLQRPVAEEEEGKRSGIVAHRRQHHHHGGHHGHRGSKDHTGVNARKVAVRRRPTDVDPRAHLDSKSAAGRRRRRDKHDPARYHDATTAEERMHNVDRDDAYDGDMSDDQTSDRDSGADEWGEGAQVLKIAHGKSSEEHPPSMPVNTPINPMHGHHTH